MNDQTRRGFWIEALNLSASVADRIWLQVLLFGALAGAITFAAVAIEQVFTIRLALELMPHELAGAVLGLLLVLRTNSGYDRWWEARKLWGGFVDRTRNVAIAALTYGPADPAWQERFVRLTAAFPIVVRMTLREERSSTDLVRIVGAEEAQAITAAEHMPVFVATQLANLLRRATDQFGMDRFGFLQVDHERALLMTNFGGCERILLTPLPLLYSIKVRQFLVLFLLTLPLALLHRMGQEWLVPVVTMAVAYPMLSLDQMGIELENPFDAGNLSHLNLEGMSKTIESNLLALLAKKEAGTV